MRIKHFLSILLVFVVILFHGCGSDSPTTTTNNNSSSGITATITSSQSGNMSFDNFKLLFGVGTVPHQQNGTDGTIIFSMNSSSTMPSGLPSLPSGFTQTGKILQAGPDNFVFNTTIRVYMPAGGAASPNNLYVLGYFPEENGWRVIPSMSGTDSSSGAHYLFVDVLKLGYFVMAQNTSSGMSSFLPQGGVQWCIFDDYFYVLTVKSVIFSDPNQGNSMVGGMVGRTFVSPNNPGMVFPSDNCRGIVPQGTYEFWVSRRHWSSNDIETYSAPVPVSVSTPLNWPIGWIPSLADGWIVFGCSLPAGSWVPGRPTNWPNASVTYGSGTIQATLTWHNASGTEADMDLHLYGPNNLHIWYFNTTSANFALDRDWQLADGDAIENIYSTTTTVPSGNYRVNVAFYSGVTKSFNCRVIVNGNVTNYSGSLGAGSVDVRSFTIQ